MELVLILAIMAAIAVILEYIFKSRWSKGLRVKLFFSKKEACTGETIQLKEEVSNRNHIFMPYIELKFNIKNNGEDNLSCREIFSLTGRQKVTRTQDFVCEKRGVYDINQIYVISKGLFLRRLYDYQTKSHSRLIVYPEMTDVSNISLKALIPDGDTKSSMRLLEDPFTYRGVRDYESADSVSRINWNASASTGKMMANTYEDTRRLAVNMVLQLPDYLVERSEILAEESISLAASLFLRLMEAEVPVNLTSNGTDGITGFPVDIKGRMDASYSKIALETFARINAKKLDENQRLENEASTTLVLISQVESAGRNLVKQALSQASKGNFVLWILVQNKSKTAEDEVEKLMGQYGGKRNLEIMPCWV